MKQKLNLYTVIIVGYSLLVCAICKPSSDRTNSSPLFSTTPINHNKSNIYKEVKPTFTKVRAEAKQSKASLS